MKQYEIYEATFTGPVLKENYAEVDLQGEFALNGKTSTVQGFYDGNGIYKVRYMPLETGVCAYKITGIFNKKGKFEVKKGTDHGPVKAIGTHFEFDDKTAFYPVGTTVYALAHQDEAVTNDTMKELHKGYFNKVRMCVFPKSYDYNHNEPPFYAFNKKADGTWDVSSPNIDFWHRFESILNQITKMGIEIDLILFHPYDRWGFSKMSMEENKLYLNYLLRRIGSFSHIWWSLANEYDLMPTMTPDDFHTVEDYIYDHEGNFHHLMSCHQCFAPYDHSHPHITHCSIQDPNPQMIPGLLSKYHKPVMYDEMCYEGNLEHDWGNISGFEEVNRCWETVAAGGYPTHGETYRSDDEVLWWAKGGKLKGQAPKRLKFLKEFLKTLPGPLSQIPNPLAAFANMPKEELEKQLQNIPEHYRPIILRVASLPEVDKQMMSLRNPSFASCYKDEAFVYYHAIHRPYKQPLELPAGNKYRIDVIDVWDMTRKTVLEHVSGKIDVPLPSKEGIAVIAIKE